MRDELTVDSHPPIEPSPACGADAVVHGPHVVSVAFTGRGGEYFRIWVVNLLLTLLTLGLYSAWAKVRKAKYFRHNTWVDGHVFDYHGKPVAILRGRLLAVVLLAAYTWAFEFSNAAGLMTLAALCAVGPWLFMRAQQFSLSNTSFRGLRFGFRARTGEAYRVVLPVLAVWLSPSVAVALMSDNSWLYWIPILVWFLAVPWMHHRLKAYQRTNTVYGDRRVAFTPATLRFYAIYAKGVGLVVLAGLLAVAFVVLVSFWRLKTQSTLISPTLESMLMGGVAGLLVYVVAWPYLAARLQQVVWNRTRLGDICFRTEIMARPLFGLVLRNVTLTLVSAGAYWPWAAMALARYRIECVRIESDVPLSTLATRLEAKPVTAAGDGASDVFGFDVGL